MTTTLAFFAPGPWEIAIVALIAVLLFGSQLPKIAKNFGAAIPQFKKGMKEVQREIAEVEAETQRTLEAAKTIGDDVKEDVEA